MGQYYKPALIQDFGNKVKNWVLSHDIDRNGLKLMEHSWIGNTFVSTIEGLLVPGGDWHKKSIVWAGDYADKEPDTEKNIYELCIERKKILHKILMRH